MSSLVSRRSILAQRLDPNETLGQQIAQAQTPGLVAAAHLQAAAFATHVAIQQSAMLSMAVNRAFEQSPAGEQVYNAIFLAYGSVAVSEIQRLGVH
jgi:hypothetical protein